MNPDSIIYHKDLFDQLVTSISEAKKQKLPVAFWLLGSKCTGKTFLAQSIKNVFSDVAQYVDCETLPIQQFVQNYSGAENRSQYIQLEQFKQKLVDQSSYRLLIFDNFDFYAKDDRFVYILLNVLHAFPPIGYVFLSRKNFYADMSQRVQSRFLVIRYQLNSFDKGHLLLQNEQLKQKMGKFNQLVYANEKNQPFDQMPMLAVRYLSHHAMILLIAVVKCSANSTDHRYRIPLLSVKNHLKLWVDTKKIGQNERDFCIKSIFELEACGILVVEGVRLIIKYDPEQFRIEKFPMKCVDNYL